MSEMVGPAQLAAAVVALQRLAELVWSRRNERRLRTQGGIEHGRGHYPLLVGLHGGWLLALALLVPADVAVNTGWLILFAMLQLVRLSTLVSLGRFWTTRIIVLPGHERVRRGPYRWLRHPNYAVVAAEIVALPMTFGAWLLALGFGVVNLVILGWRIRVEERALTSKIRAI